ncbi:uncharacterized protein LOC128962428 [Oppia nitens]|uniref:uncharacterized protein LOC128962428 n=1 Tax=Oppia nitens TaxID=1686743 RepID=UPI0023DA4C2F|nr:uncharacterized protein LOC128962428 [Oppia nitens]
MNIIAINYLILFTLIYLLTNYVESHEPQNFKDVIGGSHEPHIHPAVPHQPIQTSEQLAQQTGQTSGTDQLWAKYGTAGFMHDMNHLREEASNLLYLQQSEKISNDESAFYYTKLHDFNSDAKLDGLELLLAVRHSLIHHNSTYETVPLEDLSGYVDTEINLMDLNNDGFVDYGEIYTYMEKHKSENQNKNN